MCLLKVRTHEKLVYRTIHGHLRSLARFHDTKESYPTMDSQLEAGAILDSS